MKLFWRWFSIARLVTPRPKLSCPSANCGLRLRRHNIPDHKCYLLRTSPKRNLFLWSLESHVSFKTYAASDNQQKSVPNKPLECGVTTNLSSSMWGLDADWSTHELFMVTCAEMWDEMPNGAEVIVGYVDTASKLTYEQRSQMPTALVIKSGFTDSIELKTTLDELINQGFRLVIPDMMGCGITRGLTKTDEDCFSNLVGERSAFILDFANAIGISRFDVGIGHKLGCDPITVIGANFDVFRSVVLVSPVPKIRAPRIIRPEWLSRRMLYWSFNWLRYLPAWLWFTFKFRSNLMKFTEVNDLSFRRMQTILSILHGVDFRSMVSMATLLEARRVPLLYIYSQNDKLVDSSASAEYAELFGITAPLTKCYDEKGQRLSADEDSNSGASDMRARGIRICSSTGQPLHSDLNRIIVHEIRTLVDSNNCKTNQVPA